MIKNIAQFEIKVGEKVFHLLCQADSTWGEIHDVLFKMKDFVVQKMNELHQAEANSQGSEVSNIQTDCSNCSNECQSKKEGS